MLKLTRGIGNRIMVGDRVIIKVLDIAQEKVHLDIQVLGEVSIRTDLMNKTQEGRGSANVNFFCKEGECVRISKQVTLEVVEIRMRDMQVRLGIDAPKEINIYREEISAGFKKPVVK